MAGIVPPIRPNAPGHDLDRSPYSATLAEVVQMFATSQERANILSGLFNYRAALHANGLVTGFQWLDGSFLENIEDLDDRPPNDIDVVTFFRLPAGTTQADLMPHIQDLFDTNHTKENYRVDAYPFDLGIPLDEGRIRNAAYWYSMWSHRRDGMWKGFVQVDLDPAIDAASQPLLEEKIAAGFAQ